MATLDEITKEKERVSEALARVDAQREKLAVQLLELEATERVLARYSKGSGARRMASATPITATNVGAPGRAGGPRRSTTTKPAGGERSSPSLSDQVLALATGKTQQEIATACKGARPNHVGAPRFPGTSGAAVSKSGMEGFTPRSREEQGAAV